MGWAGGAPSDPLGVLVTWAVLVSGGVTAISAPVPGSAAWQPARHSSKSTVQQILWLIIMVKRWGFPGSFSYRLKSGDNTNTFANFEMAVFVGARQKQNVHPAYIPLPRPCRWWIIIKPE